METDRHILCSEGNFPNTQGYDRGYTRYIVPGPGRYWCPGVWKYAR